jgi:hypothetical protein
MTGLAEVRLIGHVMAKPTGHQTHSGVSVANFSITVNGPLFTMPGMVVREQADIDRIAHGVDQKLAGRFSQKKRALGRND